MNRRGFLSSLLAGTAALTLDPERLLWVPGKKRIFIPATPLLRDDTAYIQGLMDESVATGREVIIPFGRYRITKTLIAQPGTRLCGEGKGDHMPFLIFDGPDPGIKMPVAEINWSAEPWDDRMVEEYKRREPGAEG